MLLRTPNPEKGIIYWNLQWEVLLGWVSYFALLREEELLSLHWDPIVLLQARPVETYYICNGICTIKRGGENGGPGLAYLPSPSQMANTDVYMIWSKS